MEGILFNVNEPNSVSNGRYARYARVGTGALARPSRAQLGSASRRRHSPNFSRTYRNERTSNSVSSEMIASTPHSLNSRMRSARFTVQTMVLFPAA